MVSMVGRAFAPAQRAAISQIASSSTKEAARRRMPAPSVAARGAGAAERSRPDAVKECSLRQGPARSDQCLAADSRQEIVKICRGAAHRGLLAARHPIAEGVTQALELPRVGRAGERG